MTKTDFAPLPFSGAMSGFSLGTSESVCVRKRGLRVQAWGFFYPSFTPGASYLIPDAKSLGGT